MASAFHMPMLMVYFRHPFATGGAHGMEKLRFLSETEVEDIRRGVAEGIRRTVQAGFSETRIFAPGVCTQTGFRLLRIKSPHLPFSVPSVPQCFPL